MAGALVALGRGALDEAAISAALENPRAPHPAVSSRAVTAPAHGLWLERVDFELADSDGGVWEPDGLPELLEGLSVEPPPPQPSLIRAVQRSLPRLQNLAEIGRAHV